VASPPTANEITAQIASLMTPVIGTSGTKKAKILDYLPEAFLVADHEDTTALQSPLDTVPLTSGTKQRVNCLLVSSLGFSQSVAPPQKDATRHLSDARGRNVVTRRFAVIYLYEFGEESEATFNTNVEVIRNTLNQNQKLGFPVVASGLAGQGEFIDGHDGWQVPIASPEPFPGTIAHVANGTLTVKVVEPL
jgi:hypothetical protein